MICKGENTAQAAFRARNTIQSSLDADATALLGLQRGTRPSQDVREKAAHLFATEIKAYRERRAAEKESHIKTEGMELRRAFEIRDRAGLWLTEDIVPELAKVLDITEGEARNMFMSLLEQMDTAEHDYYRTLDGHTNHLYNEHKGRSEEVKTPPNPELAAAIARDRQLPGELEGIAIEMAIDKLLAPDAHDNLPYRAHYNAAKLLIEHGKGGEHRAVSWAVLACGEEAIKDTKDGLENTLRFGRELHVDPGILCDLITSYDLEKYVDQLDEGLRGYLATVRRAAAEVLQR